ncbi:hypothetical protein [Escherichia coli]|uniref:hypothetical protein n=1 Tax=Escherichia coli TaxID=562 RepID=UPI0012FF9D72|nr:hypothetical protein [Escherichia coli]EET7735032.1 hypothetical protein [Escherichia coli]EEX9039472.1 hypothetical protein [Escherichia coli]NJX03969.1 hypothetical protein [Escherichia coli]HDR7817234.1 hypothetical protein [Escherichia coli]
MSRIDAEDILSLPRGYLVDKPLFDINSKIKLKNSLTPAAREDKISNVIDLFTCKY